jgi:hypothetical protein
MLSIERKLVKIAKVTGVDEFKGDQYDHGCSVRIQMTDTNHVLDELDPDVRKAFYERDKGKPSEDSHGQTEMSLPPGGIELTKRKAAGVGMPISFSKEFAGYTIIFHRGATEASDIKLTEVDLTNFSADLQADGIVLLSFNAYMKPSAEMRGPIDFMSKHEIEITLTPPAAAQPDLVDKAKGSRGKKKTAAEKADENPFANTDIPPLDPEAEEETEGAD